MYEGLEKLAASAVNIKPNVAGGPIAKPGGLFGHVKNFVNNHLFGGGPSTSQANIVKPKANNTNKTVNDTLNYNNKAKGHIAMGTGVKHGFKAQQYNAVNKELQQYGD